MNMIVCEHPTEMEFKVASAPITVDPEALSGEVPPDFAIHFDSMSSPDMVLSGTEAEATA
jgi:hypothetical protein